MVASEVVHFACTQFSSLCMYYHEKSSIVDKQLSTGAVTNYNDTRRNVNSFYDMNLESIFRQFKLNLTKLRNSRLSLWSIQDLKPQRITQ